MTLTSCVQRPRRAEGIPWQGKLIDDQAGGIYPGCCRLCAVGCAASKSMFQRLHSVNKRPLAACISPYSTHAALGVVPAVHVTYTQGINKRSMVC